MSWWEQLEDDRWDDGRKAERLARVIARLGGSQEEKVKFLTTHMALMEAEAEREGHEAGSRRFGGAMKSIAFRYWRQALKQRPVVREFEKMAGAPVGKQEQVRRLQEFRQERKRTGL